VTDFPDIRFKALIQSAKDGSLLIIPREGGYMVRLYVELAKLESLYAAMRQSPTRLRRTLAGALVTLDSDWIVIERAPARRASARRGGSGSRSAMPKHRKRSFTK